MSEPRSLEDQALDHLWSLLHILSDLHPGEKSKAFDDAARFYETHRGPVPPSGIGITYLVHCSAGERPAIFDERIKEYHSPFPDEIMDEIRKESQNPK